MASVLRRRGRVQVKVDARERAALLNVIADLGPRVASAAPVPPAYDERELQAEYERWVRPEVDHGRDADITVVRECLSAGDDTLLLTEAQTLSWLRAFNHLRAAAGSILDIDHDGWEEEADPAMLQRPEYGVLMTLAFLQEELVAALDS